MKKDYTFLIKDFLEQRYKFTTHSPYLSYRADTHAFVDYKGYVIKRYKVHHELHDMGKRAFELLDIDSEGEFDELCKGYFNFIYLMVLMACELNIAGKLKLTSPSNENLCSDCFANILSTPDHYGLISYAPTLLKLSSRLNDDLNTQYEEDGGVDITKDIYLASLIHTMIEIDNGICAYDLDDPDALIAVKEATTAYEIATAIDKNELIKKKLRTKKAKFAATKRHEVTALAKQKLVGIWSSGKYKSRDICAEQECAHLGIAFSTARKALRNTPDPSNT